MIWRSEPRRGAAVTRDRRDAGFTLIEVIVTLAILGFALALIVGYKPAWSGALGLRGMAAELASELRLARSEAVLRNRPVFFEIDLAARQFRVGDRRPHQLPRRLDVSLLTVAGERRDVTKGDIRFNADGSSTGGRVTLADGARRITVGVEWLTGRVGIGDVQ
jgi:general secretion pathway protein H